MKEFSVTLKEKVRQIDFVVLLCVLGITALSVVTLIAGRETFGSNRALVQACAALAGIVCMITLSFMDYDKLISRFGIFIFAGTILLLVLVQLVGEGERGNKGWISVPLLPFYLQPAELVKPFFVIIFARHIDRFKKNINSFWRVLVLLCLAGIYIGFILLTGDLGSALVYIITAAAMMFTAGVSLWYFLGGSALVVALSPLLWKVMSETQKARILVGFNPELDPLDKGYQPLLSRAAIAAGGFRGTGFSGGTQYQTLPESHSDFLFAVLAEKFGFFGCFLCMALMTTLIIRLLVIARTARKDYGASICVGIAAILIFQTVENIGMCLAMLPVIGITLPFFSYGGSSMLAMYIAIGVILSIRSHNRKYYFERELS